MQSITLEHVKFIVDHYKSIKLEDSYRRYMEDIIVHLAREVSSIQGVIAALSPEALALIDRHIDKN